MPTVQSILNEKATSVHTVAADATVHDAACLMNERHIGSLMVLDQDRIAGILTERDIMTRVVAASRVPEQTAVREVMTEDILSCTPGTRLSEARHVMREKRIRHLPVLEQGRLVGMISIGDLNIAENQQLEQTIHHMEDLLTGNVF